MEEWSGTILKMYEIVSLLSARVRGNAATTPETEAITKKTPKAQKAAADPDDKIQNRIENQTMQISNLKQELGDHSIWPAAKRHRGPKGEGKGGTDKGKGKKGKGKGHEKSKGKGLKGKSNNRVPRELIGGRTTHDDGNSFCYAFNLGMCEHKGDKCQKRLHKCMKPGCDKNHVFIHHT